MTEVPSKISVNSEADGVKVPPEHGTTVMVWKHEQLPVKLISELTVNVIEDYV